MQRCSTLRIVVGYFLVYIGTDYRGGLEAGGWGGLGALKLGNLDPHPPEILPSESPLFGPLGYGEGRFGYTA